MKGIMKWPLIIALVVIVARVILELAGQPVPTTNLLSVVVLHTLLVPLYLGVRIAMDGVSRPYGTLFKLVVLYVVYARLMILPVYWLARIYHWNQPRFEGLWGPGVSAFRGFIGVPFATAAIWIVLSTVIGGLLGSLILAIGRRFFASSTAGSSRV